MCSANPGKLELCEHWKIAFDLAKQYGKRIGLRVMMSNPDIEGTAMPAFLATHVPMVELGEWQNRRRFEPRYDDPLFQSAFNELTGLLAAEYDGHPQVEYVDTAMYGFWGEGHTWPLERNPFPDYATAERTFDAHARAAAAGWKKTPLATNTQPDFSKVGNASLVDRTVRSGNWLRTDTIFIENEQIEALSNRPAWTGVTVEVRTADGSAASLQVSKASRSRTTSSATCATWAPATFRCGTGIDPGRSAPGLLRAISGEINALARSIGYRVRPSWIWTYDREGNSGLILGMVNDGIAGVPGVLRISS